MIDKTKPHWWLELTCELCIYGEGDCPYMEKGGKYRACSLIEGNEKLRGLENENR